MTASLGTRLSLASFLLGFAVTANAFQAMTSLPPPLKPSQQQRLQERAISMVVPLVPSSSHQQRQPYFHTVVLRQHQHQPSTATVSPTTILRSSSSENSDTSGGGGDEKKIEKKIAARKKRVEIGYQTVALAYALVTCISFIKYQFFQKIPIPYNLFITAGPFMASSVAFHLVGSGSNDQLKSDACKRLNLALASFGFIGLMAKDVITTAQPLWIFACLVAMVNSIKGYGYGLKGWDLKMMDGNAGAVKDILGGTLSSVKAVFALPAIFSRSAGYAAMTITFAAMKSNILYTLISGVVSGSIGPNDMNLAFGYKKLLLLTMAAFTLKEAVDQDDTESPKGWGAAPVGLGLATSVATGAMAAKSIWSGSLYLGGWIACLAVFSAVDGINRWTALNLPIKVAKTRAK